MKLLFLDFTLPQLLRDAEFPVGGWAVQLKALLTGLKKTSHRAGVLTWKGANTFVGPQSLCDLLETYDPDKGIKKLRRFYYFIPSMIIAARAYKPDVVIQSCAAVDTGVMAAIANSLAVPFVYRIASDWDADGQYRSYLTKLEQISFRYGLRNAALIICQNGYQLEHIRRTYPDKPLLLLKSAIQLPSLRELPPVPATDRYIAWIGAFRPLKNLPLLNRIASDHPSIQIRVAGTLPDQADAETVRVVEELSKRPNVRMLGYVRHNDIFTLLSGARALLSTSRLEGFSNTFLEALACGTPVVACSTVDPDSMIAKNALGLVAQDESQLSGLVQKIWDIDKEAFADISRRCRDYVETHHSLTRAAQTLLGALEPLVNSSASRR